MVLGYGLLRQMEGVRTRVKQLGMRGQHGQQGAHRRVPRRTRRHGQQQKGKLVVPRKPINRRKDVVRQLVRGRQRLGLARRSR